MESGIRKKKRVSLEFYYLEKSSTQKLIKLNKIITYVNFQ